MYMITLGIISIFMLRKNIQGTFRIIDYWINKKKLLEIGNIEVGEIVDIIKETHAIHRYRYRHRYTYRYYLIVDLNGEKIKSLYFKDNIYKL